MAAAPVDTTVLRGRQEAGRTITLTAAAYELSYPEVRCRYLKFAGAPGGPATVTLPVIDLNGGFMWTVDNQTGQDLTIKGLSGVGTAPAIANGKRCVVVWDGSEMYQWTASFP